MVWLIQNFKVGQDGSSGHLLSYSFDEKLLSWNKLIEVIQYILEKLTEKLNPSQNSGNNGELLRISDI